MDFLSPNTIAVIAEHTAELKRFNDTRDKEQGVLVSCTEAARLCKVSRATISAWISENKLRKVARGQSVGIPLEDVRRIQNPS